MKLKLKKGWKVFMNEFNDELICPPGNGPNDWTVKVNHPSGSYTVFCYPHDTVSFATMEKAHTHLRVTLFGAESPWEEVEPDYRALLDAVVAAHDACDEVSHGKAIEAARAALSSPA